MRERAEMAGGWCHLISVPGAGTTVEIWVPGSASRPPRHLEESEGDISAERETAALELAAADDRLTKERLEGSGLLVGITNYHEPVESRGSPPLEPRPQVDPARFLRR